MSTPDLDSHVYLGLWTNWSRGAILGATLTLTRERGNLLIAFTASFISFVAVHFWHIICFFCHRFYSNPTLDPRSTLHHQRQAVLRNSANPESAMTSLLGLVTAWRGRKSGSSNSQSTRLLMPVLIIAVFTWAVFTTAGGFSSKIASGVGDAVLIKSSNCGFLADHFEKEAEQELMLSELAALQSSAVNYARKCYSAASSSTGTLDCGRYVQSKISWTANTDAGCPFHDKICRSKNRNILLDTGIFDITSRLGFNVPSQERISLRSVLHCAPLVTEGYTSQYPSPNGTEIRYHYGSFKASRQPEVSLDYIFQIENTQQQYKQWDYKGLQQSGGTDLLLQSIISRTNEGKPVRSLGMSIPIPELTRSDGDLDIIFLSGNGVIFEGDWEDDWYRTTLLDSVEMISGGGNVSHNLYRLEEAASPLGCVEQWQICNAAQPGDTGCGPLASMRDAIFGAAPLFNSTEEAIGQSIGTARPPDQGGRTASRLWWAGTLLMKSYAKVGVAISFLGSNSLATQAARYSGVQYELPHEGPIWHEDVKSWFGTVMAVLQETWVYAPLGPLKPGTAEVHVNITAPELQGLCNSQLINSSSYTSFSGFGLCFTYVLGGLVVAISLILEPLLRFLYKRYNFQAYQQLEWTTNSSLQLQRLAQEELGHGEWSRCAEGVPVTKDNIPLGQLDISGREHPVIKKPIKNGDGEEEVLQTKPESQSIENHGEQPSEPESETGQS